MKVRQTKEWDVPQLADVLRSAVEKSPKSVSQICREAGISTTFWYQLAKGNEDSISFETLVSLCAALGLTEQDIGLMADFLADS